MATMDWEIDPRVANGIALLGSFMAIIMWLAPVRDIWTAEYSVFRMKSTENVATSFGFVAGCFNCILWNMFAATRLETMLVAFIVNAMGLILNSSFSICYYCYGGRKQRRETCNTFMAMIFVTALAIIFWVVEKDNHVVGYFAAFVNILMLFGPLAAAGDVIRNRSSKGMSLLPMIMTLLSSMVWLGFGIYIKEIPSMIPNALGVLFGIVQLFLFAWARKVERKELDEEILDEAFDPVTAGMSSTVQRPRLASLGSLIAEGP